MAGIPPFLPEPSPIADQHNALRVTRPWLMFFQQLLQVVHTIVSGINQLTGDVLAGPGTGSVAATLSTTGVSANTYGDSTHVGQFTVDAKGRLTAASNVAISGSIAGDAAVVAWLGL